MCTFLRDSCANSRGVSTAKGQGELIATLRQCANKAGEGDTNTWEAQQKENKSN
jgi:hypothetical protein